MKSTQGGRAAALLILAGGLGVGTLAYYVRTTPEASHVPEALRTRSEPKTNATATPAIPKTDPKPHHERTHVAQSETVRLPVFGDDISDMALDTKETPIPGGKDAMRYVADRIAEASHLEGARTLAVEVRDHVAFVQYNGAVQKGMGSMEEGAFLRALQVGFGQFTDVDKVAVEADGEPLQSGHVDLSQPLPVIRPGEKPAEEPDPKPGEP